MNGAACVGKPEEWWFPTTNKHGRGGHEVSFAKARALADRQRSAA